EAARTLLENEANPNLRNKKREQAHTLATAAGHDDIVKLLETHSKGRGWLKGLF
ncbi:MAG: ankryin, partial [Proteobacteria bacterium]|nr:ankryin [Pseudomonadota bacterium]